ncbi:predicted protein [Nematostella vectensis]|uniref:CARD domain-containing protein n=2 Tax=Nematostella vectensis TaxID=45351 RepID=A7SRU0_NEMVE|nr:uncharacterized protein LOC5504788 isoform X2 [Nematostella vectensis]XP_048586173.1 uncharacterized protein LOC5504788 isoform X2 [Nematostella vectensis]EDO33574.1 predicted protein [Nematostella vectensis]|eukprot:XP_001625674.1 predicted protein [Nematostella vectensis]
MEDHDREVIRRCYVRLEKNLEAGPHLSQLFQDDVLSEEDMEKINAKPSTKKQAAKLLKILCRRKYGLRMLIKALLLAKIQDFLAFELLERVAWNDEEIKNFREEVDGNLDRCQIIEIQKAALQKQYNELEQKYNQLEADYHQTVKELNHKVIDLQQQIDDYHQSDAEPNRNEIQRSNSIMSWMFHKKSQRKERRH